MSTTAERTFGSGERIFGSGERTFRTAEYRFYPLLNVSFLRYLKAERKEFEAKAKAWYYAELLKDERKRQNITQKALAEQIGKKREYISALEKGQTDIYLSTFISIAEALGLRFSLVLG